MDKVQNMLCMIGESQILINNDSFHLSEKQMDFLSTLRDEKGHYKYDFRFRFYLN